MIQSKPFYWVECDQANCLRCCPPPDYEVMAWSKEEDALVNATESEWKIEDGKHWCPDHWPGEAHDTAP